MDNTVLLQKTVRDNSEDLQNFLRDLKHWESDMKRKDAQLSTQSASDEEILPPVRSRPRKEKSSTKSVIENKSEKPKRISSFDYSSWEKFDVEKACEDVDKGNNCKGKEEDSDSEDDVIQETDRLKQQALYEKELGNSFVKKQKWKEAIEQYTKAIKCYDKNAVFFANRALCYLKTNQLKAAEEDCNKSLELDSSYVKSYQRRAAARIGLKKFTEAEADLNIVLKFEPNNTQAKQDLQNLRVSQKPHIDEEKNESKADKSGIKKSSSITEPSLKGTKDVKLSTESSGVESKKLPWDPVNPNRIIQPVLKPPHLRSKKPLQRIEIIDVDDNTVKDISLEKVLSFGNVPVKKQGSTSLIRNKTSGDKDALNKIIELIPEKEFACNENKKNSNVVKNQVNTISVPREEKLEIPPLPRTSVQFYTAWKKLKHNPDLLFMYLRKIDGRNFSSIFHDSLESDVYSSIIDILSSEFIKRNVSVLNYIEGLISIRRFEMLVLFMSKQDKEGIKKLLDYCVKNKEITNDYSLELKKKFKLSNC